MFISDFISFGLIDEKGMLTNAGALLADESPMRHSRRRNPIIADIFSRMNYMERRGSGFRKIKDDYHRAFIYRPELEPVFYSDTSSFWVTLYNLNYNVEIESVDEGIQKQLFEDRKTVVLNGKQLFEDGKTVV